MTTPNLANQLSERLRQADKDRTAVAPLTEIAAGDVDTAYAVQLSSVDAWRAEGRRVVGRKVGLTNPVVQQQLGVDRPDFGFLFDDMSYESGATVPFDRVLQPKVEAEVAFVLSADLDGTTENDLDVVEAAVGGIFAAFEIVGSRIADWKISITDTIADNASSGAFVLAASPTRGPVDLAAVSMSMTRSSGGVVEVVSSGTGAQCLGSPLVAAAWLATEASRRGDPLRAGDIVLTGALGPMVTVEPGDVFEATISSVGTVSVTFGQADQPVRPS